MVGKTKSSLVILGIIGLAAWVILTFQLSYAHREDESHLHAEITHMESTVPFRPVTLEELERFHGHVGPFVALGARMGEYTVTQYNMPRYFSVTVEVECPAIPPHSCLIDGLMVATGATYGKKNIHHVIADKVRVIIRDDHSGAAVTFSLKPSTIEMMKTWEADHLPVPRRGRIFFDIKAEDLFDIDWTK